MKSNPKPTLAWTKLFGKGITEWLFSEFAHGLGDDSQVYALFSSFEINPELFEIRLNSIPSRKREQICSALAIAREYAIFRERAFQTKKWPHETEKNEEQALLDSIPHLFRLEAREWIGFWAQYRQGHWSKLEWIERGVRTHVNFDASEFFARLLALRPKALILVHNHPSGVTAPSWVDYQLTDRVGALARQFGIELKGHWIVGPHSESWIPPPGHQTKG